MLISRWLGGTIFFWNNLISFFHFFSNLNDEWQKKFLKFLWKTVNQFISNKRSQSFTVITTRIWKSTISMKVYNTSSKNFGPNFVFGSIWITPNKKSHAKNTKTRYKKNWTENFQKFNQPLFNFQLPCDIVSIGLDDSFMDLYKDKLSKKLFPEKHQKDQIFIHLLMNW